MARINAISVSGHEQVTIFQDAKTGLLAIIAVHDTTLGPALGGCRMRPYATLDEAMYDVLRLSVGMTYKSSLAGLNLGGGKAVIIADRGMTEGREELFLAVGRCIDSLGGKYITAEDMGVTVSDMDTIGRETKYVTGTDPSHGGAGDPCPFTAKGTLDGILACMERAFDTPDLTGRRVALQGMGGVGIILAQQLLERGAKLTVSDNREARLKEIANEMQIDIVSCDEIYDVDADVFSPCAVGGILNEDTIPRLKCKIVAGAANNQLKTPEVEQLLMDREIIYAPDIVINSGGIILCGDEVEEGGFNQARVDERVAKIGDTVGTIIDEAKATGQFPGVVAEQHARRRIEEARNK